MGWIRSSFGNIFPLDTNNTWTQHRTMPFIAYFIPGQLIPNMLYGHVVHVYQFNVSPKYVFRPEHTNRMVTESYLAALSISHMS